MSHPEQSLRRIVIRLFGGLTVLLFCLAAFPAAAGDPMKAAVEKRVLDMKDVRGSMALLRRMVKGQAEFEQKSAAEAVETVIIVLKDMPNEFPPGSAALPSDAKPEVWTDWPGFMKAWEKTRDAANSLKSSAGKATRSADLKEGYEGLDNACEACHVKYRK